MDGVDCCFGVLPTPTRPGCCDCWRLHPAPPNNRPQLTGPVWTSLFTVPMALPLPECHSVGITQYWSFSDKVPSLSNMPVWFFHIFVKHVWVAPELWPLWIKLLKTPLYRLLCAPKFSPHLGKYQGAWLLIVWQEAVAWCGKWPRCLPGCLHRAARPPAGTQRACCFPPPSAFLLVSVCHLKNSLTLVGHFFRNIASFSLSVFIWDFCMFVQNEISL